MENMPQENQNQQQAPQIQTEQSPTAPETNKESEVKLLEKPSLLDRIKGLFKK